MYVRTHVRIYVRVYVMLLMYVTCICTSALMYTAAADVAALASDTTIRGLLFAVEKSET